MFYSSLEYNLEQYVESSDEVGEVSPEGSRWKARGDLAGPAARCLAQTAHTDAAVFRIYHIPCLKKLAKIR